MSKELTRTETAIAYIVVYYTHQSYGGPEEGGWYYESYVHEGTAIPFHANVDYEATLIEDSSAEANAEAANWSMWEDETDHHCYAWMPAKIVPRDATEESVVGTALERLAKMYDLSLGGGVIHLEITTPGYRERLPKPRYE